MNVQHAIDTYIFHNSNFDLKRDYLGMSKISGCPRAAVLEYRNGFTPSESTYRMSYAGYEQERVIKDMLTGCGVARLVNREIVATFDNRLRGHIDAETIDGDLLEIKSVSTDKFRKVQEENRPLFSHAVQVQLYMHFGNYKKCVIVYRCRETYEHAAFDVFYNHSKGREYEIKAKVILDAIDSGDLPTCTCKRCKS